MGRGIVLAVSLEEMKSSSRKFACAKGRVAVLHERICGRFGGGEPRREARLPAWRKVGDE